MENKDLYLVTGACGHLGNTIIRQLNKQNKAVRGFALDSDNEEPIKELGVELIRGDLRNISSLEPFFKNTENCNLKVIHTAGIVSIASKYAQNVFDVNVNGTANIIKLCEKYNVTRLVYTSSVHAIPEKANGEVITEISNFFPEEVEGLYAKTKAEATKLVLKSAGKGFDCVVVHPTGIIGPYDFGHAHLTQLVMDYLDGRLLACVNGGYDFVDVRDVAMATIAAMEKGRKGECYILSGNYSSVPNLMKILHEVSGRKEVKKIIPTWIAKITAPISEYYYKFKKQPPLYTGYSLYTLGSNSNFSHEKATSELGFNPRPLKETLKDTADWLIQQKRVK